MVESVLPPGDEGAGVLIAMGAPQRGQLLMPGWSAVPHEIQCMTVFSFIVKVVALYSQWQALLEFPGLGVLKRNISSGCAGIYKDTNLARCEGSVKYTAGVLLVDVKIDGISTNNDRNQIGLIETFFDGRTITGEQISTKRRSQAWA